MDELDALDAVGHGGVIDHRGVEGAGILGSFFNESCESWIFWDF